MRSRERFIRKLLSRLHNLNPTDNSRELVLLLAMFKKTSPLETFLATTPPHNDLLSKAESSTRHCGRWTRNSGALGVQNLQQQDGWWQQQTGIPYGGYPVSSNMAHKRYKRTRSNIVNNPVNMQARMQWTNLPQHYQHFQPPAFLLHRSITDTMVLQHTSTSNVCFRRNASSGEYSRGTAASNHTKDRKYQSNTHIL